MACVAGPRADAVRAVFGPASAARRLEPRLPGPEGRYAPPFRGRKGPIGVAAGSCHAAGVQRSRGAARFVGVGDGDGRCDGRVFGEAQLFSDGGGRGLVLGGVWSDIF